MGTLGSGNHYLEVQRVAEIHDGDAARSFGLKSTKSSSASIAARAGSATRSAPSSCAKWRSPPRPRASRCPTASSPARDPLRGRTALPRRDARRDQLRARQPADPHPSHPQRVCRGAAGREPRAALRCLANTCKVEEHEVGGERRRLFVHRKGATRAFGPGHPDLPSVFQSTGQPVLIGGSMGTSSYVLAGTSRGMTEAFGSACHGADAA